ncbi:MAG TPA: 2'-5' RNA ligase family protein [Streptomyces sp.]
MRRSIPAYLFADPGEVHAHITLLGPFVERAAMETKLLDDLARLFRQTAPFPFALSRVPTSLPDGTLCLEPRPTEPFAHLTEALWRAYPAYPPYGGAFIMPRPHLALAYPWAPDAGRTTPSDLTAELDALPATSLRATEACLNWYEPYGSYTVARFPLVGGELS